MGFGVGEWGGWRYMLGCVLDFVFVLCVCGVDGWVGGWGGWERYSALLTSLGAPSVIYGDEG